MAADGEATFSLRPVPQPRTPPRTYEGPDLRALQRRVVAGEVPADEGKAQQGLSQWHSEDWVGKGVSEDFGGNLVKENL